MATKQKEKKPLHLAKMNIKKGDTVLIITGKDRGKQGTVSRAMPQVNKVIIEGMNIVKKHVRPQGQTRQGGVIDRPCQSTSRTQCWFVPSVESLHELGMIDGQWGPIKNYARCAYARSVTRSLKTGRGVVKHYGIEAERKVSTRGCARPAKGV